jgi:hypothetical protein
MQMGAGKRRDVLVASKPVQHPPNGTATISGQISCTNVWPSVIAIR